MNIVRAVIVVIILGFLRTAESIRCYECVARLGPGESSACLTGEESQLRRVQCIGPSVCAVYHYQIDVKNYPTCTMASKRPKISRTVYRNDRPNLNVIPLWLQVFKMEIAVIPGTPTINHITRGCQALRYGATCEDIFNELRARGQVLPGQHTCTTCSSDLCNSAGGITFSATVWPLVFLLIKHYV